ncbi:hypothetical protein GUJ93_ZPchr0005g15151 [Zizania palustris]|uniref:Uncharacterized protein n=1 Tax=Zizania palustris TaxID=103762 RepID=A0A8J5VHH3_ZIZPA|nr:hypothetical protein GUJ93_ZPchr0005g15151 [Zizania palustris]
MTFSLCRLQLELELELELSSLLMLPAYDVRIPTVTPSSSAAAPHARPATTDGHRRKIDMNIYAAMLPLPPARRHRSKPLNLKEAVVYEMGGGQERLAGVLAVMQLQDTKDQQLWHKTRIANGPGIAEKSRFG